MEANLSHRAMEWRIMIVAGFGFRTAARKASLEQALSLAAGEQQVDALATAKDKATTRAFQDFAAHLQKPVYAIVSDVLAAQSTQTQSSVSQAARQTGSVAEAAALAAAGPGAILIQTRVVSADGCATCALAKGENA